MALSVYGLHAGDPDAVRYIGVTTRPLEDRLREHLTEPSDTHKRRWLRKLMTEGRDIGIVALDHAETEADLLWLEQFWIMSLRALGARLTNASAGGDGLRYPTPETRAKMVASHLGKKRGRAGIERHRQLMTGRPKPLGFDAGWSTLTPEQRAKRLAGFERTRYRPKSVEQIAKMAATKTGSHHTDATKNKMKEAHRAFWATLSPEERAARGLRANGATAEARHEKARLAAAARWSRRAHVAALRPVGQDVGATDINAVKTETNSASHYLGRGESPVGPRVGQLTRTVPFKVGEPCDATVTPVAMANTPGGIPSQARGYETREGVETGRRAPAACRWVKGQSDPLEIEPTDVVV